MDKKPSFAELALTGLERIRERDHDARGRAAALLLLLRGAYYTEEGKWRAMAEEDLRALWRGGIHDHIGGGFFSASFDREWLCPRFEKRLDDNAVLAFLFAEAWEKGHMGFHRDAAEEALDFCLRDLPDSSGLYRTGLCATCPEGEENPFLFTPAQIKQILSEEKGRGFAECYDITEEGNCGGRSIPNLILNQRWSLIPEGWDDLRERVRLAREERGGLSMDPGTPPGANALLLAALAKAGRVFSDRRYLAAAEELAERLCALDKGSSFDRAALTFALLELYAADFEPSRIAAAAAIAETPSFLERSDGAAPSERDRALSLAALGFDTLWRLTEEKKWRYDSIEVLRELGLHPERHGPEALGALCADFSLGCTQRSLLCACPGEEPPAALRAFSARYSPDLTVLLKTPARADALAAVCAWTAELPIGAEPVFYPRENGKTGAPAGL